MKPGYIFSSVSVIALTLILILPQLATASPTPVAQAAANPPVGAVSQAAPTLPTPTNAVEAAAEVVQPTPTQPAPTQPAPAVEDSIPLTAYNAPPEIQGFVSSLINNQPDLIVGAYVSGLFALPVLQQPAGDTEFVSPQDFTLTEYAAARDYGSIGILAHNYLSGKNFFKITPNQEIILIYGDGRLEYFRVTGIESFQALSPTNAYSDFIDLSDPTRTVIPYSTVFNSMYGTPNRVVLQTCIEANGDPSWGRIFIIAEPVLATTSPNSIFLN